MKPHMDRCTGKSSMVMQARRSKIMASRDIEIANKRRKLILAQLACNNKLWIDQCHMNARVTNLVNFHCPMSQWNLATSDSESLSKSVLLGCRIPGSACADPNIQSHKEVAVPEQVVGEADQAALSLHALQLSTVGVQPERDDLGHHMMLTVHDRTLGQVNGASTKAMEEPLCREAKLAKVNQSVISRSKPSTKSQYATSDSARLRIYDKSDSLLALLSGNSHMICAARTPPANPNKYKKRMGAKQSKNLEN